MTSGNANDLPNQNRTAQQLHCTMAIGFVAAIALLGFMLNRKHGNFELLAAQLLFPLIGLIVFLSLNISIGSVARRQAIFIFGAIALLMDAALLTTKSPSPQMLPTAIDNILYLQLPILTLFGVGVITTVQGNWLGRWSTVLIMAAFAGLCIWVIRNSAPPGYMDVYLFQQDSAKALSQGVNPYSITFPNLYGPSSPYYAPQVIDHDRVTFGFPYMPLPLLTEIGSWLISGDVRYAHLAAFLATFAVIGLMEAGPLALLACALFAMTPDLSRIVYYGWTEPLMLPWLALTAWAMRKGYAGRAVAFFGLFLASKQYCAIFVPLIWFLLPDPRNLKQTLKLLSILALAGAIPTLPLVLWNFKAFWYSAVTIQVLQPFRFDALSIPALIAKMSGATTPPTPAFIMLVPAYLVVFLRFKRSPTSLATAIALVGVVFFAFNKQAFLNYYLLVLGSLAIALAHVPLGRLHAEPVAATA